MAKYLLVENESIGASIHRPIFVIEREPQRLPPAILTIEAAEKVCTERESNTTGAKARRILNHLWPD
jgi:hypothetical protein